MKENFTAFIFISLILVFCLFSFFFGKLFIAHLGIRDLVNTDSINALMQLIHEEPFLLLSFYTG